MTWIFFVIQAIAAIRRRTGEVEISVREIHEEAINQAKRVKSYTARGKLEMSKALGNMRDHMGLTRNDDGAGRYEDENTIILTPLGVAIYSALGDVVVNGPNGHPKAEESLRGKELKKLHTARFERFKKLGGRLPSPMTLIQANRKIREEMEGRIEAENQVKRYEAELDAIRQSTVPLNTGTGGIGDHSAGISSISSAATPSHDNAPETGDGQNLDAVPVPRTPKPLVRSTGSGGSFIFGGLASPEPQADRRLLGEDQAMDVDNRGEQANPSVQGFSNVAPVTPARQRTSVSHAHLAYPSPASVLRRNVDAGPSNLEGHATPSKGVQTSLSEQASPGPLHNAISYVWSKITPFTSRGDQRGVVSFQEAIDAIVKERDDLLKRAEKADLCMEEIEKLKKDVKERNELIASLRQRNQELMKDALEDIERQKKRFADYLLSDAC